MKHLSGRTAADLSAAIWSTAPFRRDFGAVEGTPLDRYYIGRFLDANRHHIRGDVLEIAETTYTKKYGADVTKSHVLHAVEGNKEATIVGDLVSGSGIPKNAYDAIICTQTMHVLNDPWAAIRTIYEILRPNGVALLTFPGITQVSRYDMDRWGDYWRFTDKSARFLCEKDFGTNAVDVQSYGNVFAAVCLLHGVVLEEVETQKLDISDQDYPLIIGTCCKKSG